MAVKSGSLVLQIMNTCCMHEDDAIIIEAGVLCHFECALKHVSPTAKCDVNVLKTFTSSMIVIRSDMAITEPVIILGCGDRNSFGLPKCCGLCYDIET